MNCPAYGFDLSFAGNSWNPSTHHNYIRQATGHSAAKAVDGDPDSFAMPLMEKFAWMLQVDLGEKLPLDRLTLHFAEDPMGNPLYATRFEVLVSNNIDEEVWESMGEVENQDPSQATVDLKGVEARHLRIRSIKPDGPRQTGGIMAVSELEVFGR
ncbi:MAG: F5/8 type C domain protein [candidate division BRC1 bacterium ADurb.BinA292]|nr:MAG: F5/8 type C domain protein [candidate division BRC1 bacterium ADurb.BinA292]